MLITTKLNLETAGGSVVDLHLKAKSLVDAGHDVTVVTAFSENNRPAHDLPYRLREEFKPSRKFLAIQKSAYELLKKYEKEADVFYIDGHVFCYGAGLYRLLGGHVPVVGFFNIKLTGWFDAHPQLKNMPLPQRFKAQFRSVVERYLLIVLARKLDAYIFTTPYVAALYRAHGFPNSRTHIIPDFADGGSNIPVVKHSRKNVSFFSSGRMIPEKGFDLLLRAFSKIDDTNATLVLSGGGPELDALKQLAKKLGIQNRVEFPGWVERNTLYSLMDASDVFVFPRWTIEYSSVLLIEAMMRGLPAIVPRGGGIEWLAGEGAVSFKENDEEELAHAMSALAKDRQKILSLSEKAKTTATELQPKVLGEKLEKALTSAVR